MELNRYEIAKMETQFALLRDNPATQAEYVAKHYTAHASLAATMLKAVEMRKQAPSVELNELIAHHFNVIAENHRNEFGIALDWST